MEEAVRTIAKKWEGIPLKGTAQDELLEDFKEAGITDSTRHLVSSFKKCCNLFSSYGIELKEKQATKKDLEQWPQYLRTPREKFKIIIAN